MSTLQSSTQVRSVARVTSVLLKGGKRLDGDPLCWAEIKGERNGTHYVNPIKFETDGTFTHNAAFDKFEIMPVENAPADIKAFLNRRWGHQRR